MLNRTTRATRSQAWWLPKAGRTGLVCLRVGLAGALVASAPQPSWASDVRPSAYLERGEYVTFDNGTVFVADGERGSRGGHWFRVAGQESSVFYGLGSHPVTDWIWPNHGVSPAVWDLVAVSAAGASYLTRYQEMAGHTTGFARIGALVGLGGLAGTAGGLAYNLTNATREMQPIFFVATALTALAGFGFWAGAAATAHSNEALLDQALEAYNREWAGRRNPRAIGEQPAGTNTH
ncbi:MAG: hypothetical protein VKP62_07570 [Candidatus Sericytochromatia bacterium]|nr:hypothetical protein [Candidatus Sericytochromatia bacterium]